MPEEERRKKIRIDSLNLFEVSVDENEIVVNQGMGRTLNVSETGILIETYFPIELNSLLSLTVVVADDLININGKVVHSKPGKDKMFETGVQFLDIDQSASQMIKKIIKLFKEQKKADS